MRVEVSRSEVEDHIEKKAKVHENFNDNPFKSIELIECDSIRRTNNGKNEHTNGQKLLQSNVEIPFFFPGIIWKNDTIMVLFKLSESNEVIILKFCILTPSEFDSIKFVS